MKEKINLLHANGRTLLLRGLARLHCGLLAAMLFATVFALLPAVSLSVRTGPVEAFLRGLLLAVPAALCYYAIKRLKALWQFLLAALGLCGLSWLLAGHWGGAALMAVMCLFRVRVRLQEEEEGPIASFFDQPAYPALAVFALAFLASAVAGLAVLQRLSLVGAALYLLVCLGFHGLSRLDGYLVLNQGMRNLPARRIQRIAGTAVAAVVLAGAVLLLPPAFTSECGVRIQLPSHTQTGKTPAQRAEEDAPLRLNQEQPPDFLGELEGPSWQIPPIVSYLFFGLIGTGTAVVVILGVVRFFKDFSRSYTDSRDLVQRLTKEERDQSAALEGVHKRPAFWDRSPSAAVRRRYRRVVLKSGKEPPQRALTPAEVEAWAGLREERLHQLYEKARYGPEPCTAEEAREAGRLG